MTLIIKFEKMKDSERNSEYKISELKQELKELREKDNLRISKLEDELRQLKSEKSKNQETEREQTNSESTGVSRERRGRHLGSNRSSVIDSDKPLDSERTQGSEQRNRDRGQNDESEKTTRRRR